MRRLLSILTCDQHKVLTGKINFQNNDTLKICMQIFESEVSFSSLNKLIFFLNQITIKRFISDHYRTLF